MTDVLKILVVDDDAVDRRAVKRALTKAEFSCEITEVSSGHQAIATLNADPFDCVFLDYGLPDLDGLVLVQRIKALEIQTPLIVLTGQGDEEIAVDLMKAGASDYLSKSKISPVTLARMVKNSISLYRANRAAELANQKLRANHERLQRQNAELEQQRKQIEYQNQKLIEASQLKSQFLATMSHELKTPLNAIMGFSQLLLEQYPDPLTDGQNTMVERIFDNSKSLFALLTEVLDFSKLEAGFKTLNVSPCDLSLVVLAVVDELRALAMKKNLSLQTALDLNDPHVINDEGALRRILVNLVSNAIKFTETGAVTIYLQEVQPNHIQLKVQDSGIGIPSEYLKTIFEPFRQVDQNLTRSYQGTGLGLAITASLVETMGGTIAVESTPGRGSTFLVSLPRQVQMSEDLRPSIADKKEY